LVSPLLPPNIEGDAEMSIYAENQIPTNRDATEFMPFGFTDIERDYDEIYLWWCHYIDQRRGNYANTG